MSPVAPGTGTSSAIKLAPALVSLALLFAVGPAAAAVPVTTGETDTGQPPTAEVVIVDPLDGAVIVGTPNAVVAITIESTGVEGAYVGLQIDDVTTGNCADQTSPCTLEATLGPGTHVLVATGQVFADEPAIESAPVTIEITEAAATDTSGTPTGSESEGSASSGGSGGSASTGDGSGGDPDDKGCACAADSNLPDLLAFALAAPLVLRRRRPRVLAR